MKSTDQKKCPDLTDNDYLQEDLEYMSSLSAAVLEQQTPKSHRALWIASLGIIWLLIWSAFAELDERTRGMGKVIPSQKIQVVQNLEGGIIEQLYVKEGDRVKKGQEIIKLSDIKFAGSFNENRLKMNELIAKSYRLNAEASGTPFDAPPEDYEEMPKLLEHERSLYLSHMQQLQNNLAIIDKQISQKQNERLEAKAKNSELKNALELIEKEIAITEPLTKNNVVSEVQFLQIKRQAAIIKGDYKAAQHTIKKVSESIEELKKKRSELTFEFQNNAKQEWNKVDAEIDRIKEEQNVLADRVQRTIVRSPVDGTVKQILISTVGGVIKPGMDLIEIVPDDDTLLIEAKINPADIAYIYPGQSAMVKFTAYDFSIYGGLEGTVKHVSADTITDEKENSFYLVQIQTDKRFLGNEETPLEIMVGMTVNVDILTGKKTVLDYLLKPILKVQQNALREH
ncbi:MAG: HlyD family type I secretion periplasmic adaptor subunit [Sulfurimonadaceae bacterium]|nr:HlyD family type I secretion periplasmic adaptor subunit [Sulfurimonadaceae bacterium]